VREVKRIGPGKGILPALTRHSPTLSDQTRHPAPNRQLTGVSQSQMRVVERLPELGTDARDEKMMQKRNDNNCQKKISSALARLCRHSRHMTPKYVPPCHGLYNSRITPTVSCTAPSALRRAQSQPHCAICMNCSADNTKTLVNTHKLSSNARTSQPHRQDPNRSPSHKLHESHSSNTQTLVNSHKLSSSARTRQPAPARP